MSYEVVLADGSVTTCSLEDNSDLFYSIPWSYGTLGFLVSAKIKIIPSKRFVKLNYQPAYSVDKAIELMSQEINKENAVEFIECLVFSADTAVVMTGDMVDFCELSQLNEIGKWHKPWFFKHVQSFLDLGPTTEYIPIRDYYHRHSRFD
jgi:delta24-sterol reductase